MVEEKKNDYINSLDAAFSKIKDEVLRAKSKYKDNFNSYHEGYAVILEEVDELWDEIKKKNVDRDNMQIEAIQTAAMLFRFIVELL